MNNTVIEYDENGVISNKYKNAKVAAKLLGMHVSTFRYHIIHNHPINEKYYKYEDQSRHYNNIVKCDNCGTEFSCEPWRIKKRKNMFCCKKCEGEFRRKESSLNCTCDVCGKLFHRKQSQMDRNTHNYCSIECHKIGKMEYMLGENNHQYGLKGNLNASWISDEKISYYGYKLIRNINHPFANSDGFVFEHRLIAEKYLLNDQNSVEIDGELYLSPDYVVHHIDFNKLNNDVNNLRIMLRSDHTKMHYKLRMENELREYCKENNIGYINTDGIRNGGFGSTDKQ